MRLFIIASALLALAACASNEPTAPAIASAAPAASGAVVASEDKVTCHRVQDPGALVTHSVCEKQSDVDLRAQGALQDAANAQQRAHMHAVPSSGG